jgi:hypothetical protein
MARLLLAALLLVASGCVFNRRGPSRATTFDVPAGEIALSVTNHNYLDVVIYILRGGQSMRVGTVTGSSSYTFYVPFRLLGLGRDIQLVGDAIGSGDVARTEILIIQPGQYIEWTLETDLRRSSVGVY